MERGVNIIPPPEGGGGGEFSEVELMGVEVALVVWEEKLFKGYSGCQQAAWKARRTKQVLLRYRKYIFVL